MRLCVDDVLRERSSDGQTARDRNVAARIMLDKKRRIDAAELCGIGRGVGIKTLNGIRSAVYQLSRGQSDKSGLAGKPDPHLHIPVRSGKHLAEIELYSKYSVNDEYAVFRNC